MQGPCTIFIHILAFIVQSLFNLVWIFTLTLQVPLGIIMKNENKTDEMVDILSYLHQYVPMQSETKVANVPEIEVREEIQFENIHHILIGGDQLTSERIRGAQGLRKNSVHAAGRLEGFLPMSEDWHAKVCYLQVCIKNPLERMA